MKKYDSVLTKSVSALIKIISIFLMFFHHFFSYDEWIVGTNYYISVFHIQSVTVENFLSFNGKLCVAIFTVLSGYGMYYSLSKDSSIKKCLYRILTFLISFWTILLTVFIPLFFAFGNKITFFEFLLSFLTVHKTFNLFCWYVHFYIIAVLAILVYHRIINRQKNHLVVNIIVITLAILIPFTQEKQGTVLEEFLLYFPSMLMGYLLAQYQLYEFFINKLKSFSNMYMFILGFFGMGIILFIRYAVYVLTNFKISIQIDSIFATFFILFAIVIFSRMQIKKEDKIIRLGKATTFMWYLHALFFGVYADNLQWIAFLPKISILIVVWVYLLLLPISLLFNLIEKYISVRIKHLFSKMHRI